MACPAENREPQKKAGSIAEIEPNASGIPACPSCRRRDYATLVDQRTAEIEVLLRRCFVHERAGRFLRAGEGKDLVDFVHGAAAPILECRRCGVLVRDAKEDAASYECDRYDRAMMDGLFERYAQAFRAKEVPYRALLRPGAEVLEIGPHLGGFLAAARDWSWKATGVDVDADVVAFLRQKGFDVAQSDATHFDAGGRLFDGVFVWNCFEQIREGAETLSALRRILRPDGLLVLRVPNGHFYREAERLRAEQPGTEISELALRSLAYNNLLGFPYLFGYSAKALLRIAEWSGFRCQGIVDSRLLTLPLPEVRSWVQTEDALVAARERTWIQQADRDGERSGPWMELFFRTA
jgi:SAM-dependent methyltransferase